MPCNNILINYDHSNKTTELIRKGGGCTDTDDNAADFETRAPQPPAGTLPVTCN